MDDDVAAAIASIQTFEEFAGKGEDRIQTGLTRKVKLFDKIKAFELLGKHLQLFHENEQKLKGEVGPNRDEFAVLSDLELAAKMIYLVELAKRKQREQEAIECQPLPPPKE